MKTIIFDTETTGLKPGHICQLSYVIIEDDKVTAKNYYFKVRYIEQGALSVHGLSVEMLKELSENRSFLDQHESIFDDFNNADLLVAHNFNFDINFITKEFTTCCKELKYSSYFCTMRNFASMCQLRRWGGGIKYPKLSEMMIAFNISEIDVLEKVKEFYNDENANFHDARYDVVATYLCYIEGNKKLEARLSGNQETRIPG